MGSAGKIAGSILSGGISDLAQGDMPLSGSIEGTGEILGLEDSLVKWLKDVNSQTLTGGFDQPAKAYEAATEDGEVDYWRGIDRLIDPAGTIDYSLRDTGDVINDVAPSVTPYLQTAGSTVGGIVGSYVPVIGTAAGAAIGSGIGSKLAEGSKGERDYEGAFTDAGKAYIAGKLAGRIGNTVGSVMKPAVAGMSQYMDPALSQVLGGVGKGALMGALGKVPTAIQTGDIEPVFRGAATGGVTGGLFSTGSQLANSVLGNISEDTLSSVDESNLDYTSHGGFIYDNDGNIIGETDFSGSKDMFDAPIGTLPEKSKSTKEEIPNNQLNAVPVGSTDTLESLIKNTVKGTTMPSSVTTDPIPADNSISPDTSTTTTQDATPQISTADKLISGGMKTASALYNRYNQLQAMEQAQRMYQPLTQINQYAPIGSINPTLGNMGRNDKNSAWGTVLV